MKPKGSEGQDYAVAADDRLDDLLREISVEPELADPRVASRPAAIARLNDAELVQQVLFELRLAPLATRPVQAPDDEDLFDVLRASVELARLERSDAPRPAGRVHGPAYRQLFDDLWLYAWPVLKAFLRTTRMNQVVRRYSAYGVAIKPEDMVTLRHSEAERDALAIDVISRAVVQFEKKAILEKKWSPAGKASLRTWFIGTCALNFPRAYEQWSAQRTDRLLQLSRRRGWVLDCVEDIHDVVSELPDPADVALDRVALRALLAKTKPETRYILGRIMQGATYQEIADELRWTVAAVTQRVYRLRERIRRDQQRGRVLDGAA
jgi:DNA-directed RNA polymerase specialized sigma24 family protein